MAEVFVYQMDFGSPLKLPKKSDVGPGARKLSGCYTEEWSGSATFVPPDWFIKQEPLWKIDVIQDLVYDLERVRRHAFVEFARSLALKNPQVEMATGLYAFRCVCEQGGLQIPSDLDELYRVAVSGNDGHYTNEE